MSVFDDKKYDYLKIVPALILFYFWILVGIFKIPVPEFLSEYYQIRLCWLAVGILLVKFFVKTSDILKARLKTKKVVTNFGVFESDGSMYHVRVGEENYLVFFEGINADGIYERGDVVFICPEGQISKAGRNVLIKTELFQGGAVPVEFDQFTNGMRYCLYGSEISTEFGNFDGDRVDHKVRADSLSNTVRVQRDVISECMGLLSNKETLKRMRSEEVLKKIENILEKARND